LAADAGSALEYPAQASACRKGGFLMIKGHACKVIDMSISKTGKHGHAKCKFTATDIFDGSKMEMLESSTHNVSIPNVTRSEWQVLDLEEDGTLSLMNSDGNMKEDLNLPGDAAMAEKIKTMHADAANQDKDCFVTVLSAIGSAQNPPADGLREQIIDVKVSAGN
jgi:translation elongation factor IF5A